MNSQVRGTLRAAGAPAVFKAMAIATFAFGAAIHTLRLIIGIEAIVAHALTPAVDVAFGAFIAGTAAAGLISWRRYSGGKAGRAGYAFAMFMLIVSGQFTCVRRLPGAPPTSLPSPLGTASSRFRCFSRWC